MKKNVITAPLTYENELYAQGMEYIAGVDEVGRGCVAGPVVACAVIMPKGLTIEGVTDSKRLSPQRRRELAEVIKAQAVAYALGWLSAKEIDETGISKATFWVMRAAIEGISETSGPPDAILIDGLGKAADLMLDPAPPCRFIVRGDSESHTIAAASIIAKAERDAYMERVSREYGVYGFERNKGYGTDTHFAAIWEYGPCPLHRKTFLRKLEGII